MTRHEVVASIVVISETSRALREESATLHAESRAPGPGLRSLIASTRPLLLPRRHDGYCGVCSKPVPE